MIDQIVAVINSIGNNWINRFDPYEIQPIFPDKIDGADKIDDSFDSTDYGCGGVVIYRDDHSTYIVSYIANVTLDDHDFTITGAIVIDR